MRPRGGLRGITQPYPPVTRRLCCTVQPSHQISRPAALNPILEFYRSQTFTWGDLAVVGLLTVLEGLLSIDNALVLGLLAKRLPKHQQGWALNFGLILAVVFRFGAIFMASYLLRWTWVKLFGGGYLAYIAIRHLFFEAKHEEPEKIILDEHGHPQIVESTGEELTPEEQEVDIKERAPVYLKGGDKSSAAYSRFWPTVISISFTDIAFAVDSVLAAIALVGPAPPEHYHPKLWVVLTGGLLGICLLRIAAGAFIWLLGKFPRFEISAYLLVLVIGLKLLADWGFNSDWTSWSPGFEKWRTQSAENYEKWLSENWIFKIKPHVEEHQHAPEAQVPTADNQPALDAAEQAQKVPPLATPRHLLDFHDLRRPECMSFWLLMLASFLTGFIPPRKKHALEAAKTG
jgi:YkoY family integral membrane protein